MAPFYGWGSTASRLEPLRGFTLLFTTKFPEIPGTYIIFSCKANPPQGIMIFQTKRNAVTCSLKIPSVTELHRKDERFGRPVLLSYQSNVKRTYQLAFATARLGIAAKFHF